MPGMKLKVVFLGSYTYYDMQKDLKDCLKTA